MDDNTIATVVTWSPLDGDLPFDALNEAINWVIDETLPVGKSPGGGLAWYGDEHQHVRVFISNVSQDVTRDDKVYTSKKLGYVGGVVKEFAIVVANEPLTWEDTAEVYREHYRLQTVGKGVVEDTLENVPYVENTNPL